MVHHWICIRTVWVHAEWRCQSCRVCPGRPSSVLPMCSLRGAATYGYWYGRDDSVLHPHTYTQAQHRTSEQPPAEPREKSWRPHQHIILMDLYPTTDWRVSEIIILFPPDTLGLYATVGIVDVWFFTAMWVFGFCHQRQSLQGWSPALLCVFTLYLCQGCRGLEVWTVGGESGQNASGFSVPVVLLLTETGVNQDGASEGATPAPTTEHEDDNSLGYTGTAAAFPWFLIIYIYNPWEMSSWS